MIARSSFARGWVPSADAVNGPRDGLLRMDNCTLDERGIVALRRGSAPLGAAFADTDVHSLHTAVLNGTRYRMAGSDAGVYANGTGIASGTAGSGDIAFASYLDQILWARSTTKKKYDGTTVRTWGLAAPSAAPTLAVLAADAKAFVSGDSTESPAVVWGEDDGTGATYAAGFDGTANGAAVLQPDLTTGRGILTKTFATATDFTVYDAGQIGNDDDQIELYVYLTEPQYLVSLSIRVDVNSGTFQGKDQYTYIWFFDAATDGSTPVSKGWNHLQVRRGDMNRTAGATAGKDWSTVKAVQLEVYETAGGPDAAVRFDQWRLLGGNARPLTGIQQYYLVGVYSSGTYTGKSGPSAVSAQIATTAQGVRATVTAPVIAALDSQINELWLFRENDALGDAYRVAVLTGGPWVGAQTIDDVTSDDDAFAIDIVLERNISTPPAGIVMIAGPHYDRLLCLTSAFVYPSQPRNLDSFDTTQAVRVGDSTETAYWIARLRDEVYVGTSKDIYRFVGDWTANTEGLINVVKVPLGIAHPPIGDAIAQDGELLLYVAADGWRVLGQTDPITAGDVELLYKGFTRHGVSPVNLTTGRFKGALTGGVFTAITPEGSSTSSSGTLHRYAQQIQRWYRHTYPPAWRSLYREPDGTLLAGDTTGLVWVLDTGTQDNGADIPVVVWTTDDDDDQPLMGKTAVEQHAAIDTGGAAGVLALHLDGSSTLATTVALASASATPIQLSLSALTQTWTRIQQRLTVSCSTLRLYALAVEYVAGPIGRVRYDSGPLDLGTRVAWVTHLEMKARLTADVLVTPYIDDIAQASQRVTAPAGWAPTTTYTVPFSRPVRGRQVRIRIESAAPFYLHWIEPKYRLTGGASDLRTLRVPV